MMAWHSKQVSLTGTDISGLIDSGNVYLVYPNLLNVNRELGLGDMT